jgi:hypothetical protein
VAQRTEGCQSVRSLCGALPVTRAVDLAPGRRVLGDVQLGRLDTARVRELRAERIRCGVSKTMIAKSYRQLRAILYTAVVEHDPNGSRLPRSGADLPTQQSGV